MKEELIKLGYTFYGDETLLEYAPKNKGEIEIFHPDKELSEEDLDKELDGRNLLSPDLLSLAKYIKEKDVKDDVGVHWKDGDGKWCYAIFGRWGGGRHVSVYCFGSRWDRSYRFSGVRKVSTLKPSEISETLPSELIINGIKYTRND